METAAGNQGATLAWNTILYDKYCRFRHVLTTGVAGHGEIAFARHPPGAGARVLDLGCGFGDTTQRLGQLVGPDGAAVGIDCAARFTESARAEAAEAGVSNVQFVTGDVEVAVGGGPFDHAFARFGTMFFANPVAALRNVRRALRPDGLLCMLVWRRKLDNEWLCRSEAVVRERVGEPETGDQVHCGPGPFSLASADVTCDILKAAGYRQIALERSDLEVCIGRDVADAVAFAMSMGPGGEILRLAGAEGERRRPEVEAAVGEALAPWLREGGVFAQSSAWIVTARA